jgi:NAD(P)-dependent dehydrogenase (short-subunit alcohol dehydrogenase family)
LKGTFAMFRVASEAMVRQGEGGSLVGISSGVLYGDADHASYRAAKAGIVALVLSAALAGEAHGITVNAIAPLADTRMTQNVNMEAPSPDDVAPLAVYLLSDLSRGVTGRVISIAGGRLATWALPTEDAVHVRDGRWTPGDIHEAIGLT